MNQLQNLKMRHGPVLNDFYREFVDGFLREKIAGNERQRPELVQFFHYYINTLVFYPKRIKKVPASRTENTIRHSSK